MASLEAELEPTQYPQLLYSPLRCSIYLFVSTLLWFCISHLLRPELFVLRLLPAPVQAVLSHKINKAREIVERARGLHQSSDGRKRTGPVSSAQAERCGTPEVLGSQGRPLSRKHSWWSSLSSSASRILASTPARGNVEHYTIYDGTTPHNRSLASRASSTPGEPPRSRELSVAFDRCTEGQNSSESPDVEEQLSPLKEASEFLIETRNRSVAFVHSLASLSLALYCVLFDQNLKQNPIFGTSPAWTLAGSCMGGYFIWDIFIVFANWNDHTSWQWLTHAVICFFSLVSPFYVSFAPMCYVAACLLLFEASTPFLTLRHICLTAKRHLDAAVFLVDSDRDLKDGKVVEGRTLPEGSKHDAAHNQKATISLIEGQGISTAQSIERSSADLLIDIQFYLSLANYLFAGTFFLVRILWALLWLFPLIHRILRRREVLQRMNIYRWYWYSAAIPAFFVLNVYWFLLMIRTVATGGKARKGKGPKAAGDVGAQRKLQSRKGTKFSLDESPVRRGVVAMLSARTKQE